MIRILGTILLALLGLAFGSFLNVCLTRWPKGESIVKPRSRCQSCGRTLAWWENVPLASWLALRGRCRTCRAVIGWRYPLVELAVGALWGWQAWQFLSAAFDPGLPAIVVAQSVLASAGRLVFYWLLVALAVLDAENLWLPNWLTLPGIALGFAVTLIRAALDSHALMSQSVEPMRFSVAHEALSAGVAIAVSAGMLLLVRWVYWLVRRQEGIGLGDVKLMALLAAWLGLAGTMLALSVGVLLGAVAALSLLAAPAMRREPGKWMQSKLPLGTFLCIGGVVSALWGDRLLAAYLQWVGLS